MIIFVPVVSGKLKDGACLVWKEQCDVTGSCLLYDVSRLRNASVLPSLIAFMVGLILLGAGYFVARKQLMPKERKLNTNGDSSTDLKEYDNQAADIEK